VGENARHTQRIQKTLEDAKIKLTGVISDIVGTSGEPFCRRWWPGKSPRHRRSSLHAPGLLTQVTALEDGTRRRRGAHQGDMCYILRDGVEVWLTDSSYGFGNWG
jgi:transposase